MQPIYIDLHIHTYPDANDRTTNYDVATLVRKIKEYNGNEPFLISFTDHNTINKDVYLAAKAVGVNLLLGAELHIKNHDDVEAFHCHIYFNLDVTGENIDALNDILDKLYENKLPSRTNQSIPDIQKVINAFDPFEFMLLPHAGQKHGLFNYSLHKGEKVDDAISRSIYYNQFDGFTAREDKGLDTTREYFKRLGISEFVNLLTCSDNYVPSRYPEPKSSEASPFVPTWMMAEPTYDGVRLSLSESSRLFYQKEKPQIQCDHIGKVKLKNELIDIDVELTEGLNVVIGGSSSGKTLFVDSVNKFFEQNLQHSEYAKFKVENIDVKNPSEIHPYYIHQNFIADLVNRNDEASIDEIPILKKAFPSDDNVKRQISKTLSDLKCIVDEILLCVENIEKIERWLKDIPHPGKLITKGKIEGNIFQPLLPKPSDEEKCRYTQIDYDSAVEMLKGIEMFVNDNPFTDNISKEIEAILIELAKARVGAELFDKVAVLLTARKEEKDAELQARQGQNQNSVRNRQKLMQHLRDYVNYSRKFAQEKKKLTELDKSFTTKEVKAMGHTLYIENTFKFNEAVLMEVLNKYLTSTFRNMKDVVPENLFSTKFKQRPRVNSFRELGNFIYEYLRQNDHTSYKIVSSDGRNFYEMSPGWKSAILLDLILGYDGGNSPIIIDQPEDNLAVKYINEDLVKTIKNMKFKKQVILVSHNATIPMMADAQTIVLCKNDGKRITIRSASLEGEIEREKVLDLIADQTDGGKASVKKRVKKYNLKKFN
jgi:predicted ATP-dependent endonuclease of OLD family